MRTPQRLYAQERIIDQPALLTCPHCGALLVMGNSLTWDQTVQRLDGVLSVASRPGHGPHGTGAGFARRLHAAEGQRIAPPGSPSSDDVLGRIGWRRQQSRATSREMHTELASQMRLSASHVRARAPQRSLPLLACHARQHRDQLAQSAKQQGGVCIALDGRAPQGGEPHIWGIRALTSGWPLRSGWLSQQDHTPFAAFLEPLTHLEWPMLAGLSDTQTGLAPAGAKVWPARRSPWCQAHSLRNLAAPLAEVDAACKMALRQTVREQVGALSRQEPPTPPGQAGVLTVTGLLPRSIGAQQASTGPEAQRQGPIAAPPAPAPPADAIIPQLWRPTRDLLTLKGRPPLRRAGLETDERLDTGARCGLDLLAQRYAPRLVQLVHGLQAALSPCAQTSQELQQGAAWLRDIADI